MRFKKLRIFVGIAIVIFVLVFGNVIAFGLYQGKPSLEKKEPKKELPVAVIEKEIPKIQENKTEVIIDKSENSEEKKSDSTGTQANSPSPTPTVRHRRRRSRAS